jgi:hypothetical protein
MEQKQCFIICSNYNNFLRPVEQDGKNRWNMHINHELSKFGNSEFYPSQKWNFHNVIEEKIANIKLQNCH